MVWRRQPSRQMPVTVDRRKGKITETVAFQNEPKPWDMWLRRGGLCEATENFLLTGHEVEGVETLIVSTFEIPGDEYTIKKGELVTYLGRLVVGGKYTSHYQFLCTRGIVICDPSFFKDAREDENGA